MGRKGPRAKTKRVLKSVSKMQQFGSMQNLKFQTFLNKNPPNTALDLNTSGRELDVKEGGVALPVGDQVGGDAGVEAGCRQRHLHRHMIQYITANAIVDG